MELIEPEQAKNQGPLTEPEPRYQTTTLPVKKTEHGQAWVRLAAAIILAAVLVVLIVLLARWIYHKAHNNSGPNTTTQNTPAISANNPPASPAPNASSKRPSSNSSNTSGSSANSTGQITNTGPGDVAAIFVGASLAAAGLHYLISVRRFAKNS